MKRTRKASLPGESLFKVGLNLGGTVDRSDAVCNEQMHARYGNIGGDSNLPGWRSAVLPKHDALAKTNCVSEDYRMFKQFPSSTLKSGQGYIYISCVLVPRAAVRTNC